MTEDFVRFALLFFLALLVGATFGVWLGFDPAPLSAGAYVEMQQNTIRGMNVVMPVLGALCIVLTVTLAVLTKADSTKRALLATAALLLIAAAVITRFGNQPINALVMTWNSSAPPPEWTALRDQWWQLHIARTLAGMGALALTLLAVLRHPR